MLSYPTLYYPILSYPALYYPILSYPTLYYPVLSFPTPNYSILLSYHTLSYFILPYPPTHHHRVIAENKEKTVQQCDLDGKTALDLALEEDIFTGDNITKEVIFRLFIVMFLEVYGE